MDVYAGVTQTYQALFIAMEKANYLDIHNEVHLFCLHYVFLPRINNHLQKFIAGWNAHPLSTEKSMTPNQLWISGLHAIAGNGSKIDSEVWEPQNDASVIFFSFIKS